MFGLVRKSKLEQLLREQLTERERIVQILVEQVEFFRAQLGVPTNTVSRAAQGEPPIPLTTFTDDTEIEIHAVPSDEEEQLEAMLQANVISQAEHDEALERLKRRDPDDIIE